MKQLYHDHVYQKQTFTEKEFYTEYAVLVRMISSRHLRTSNKDKCPTKLGCIIIQLFLGLYQNADLNNDTSYMYVQSLRKLARAINRDFRA